MRASKTEMAVNARWVRIWPFAEFMATLCLKRAEKAKHPLRHKPTAASGSGHASRSRLAPQESPFSPRHLPTWRNWVPHSYGAGRCESMGAGGGRSMGPGGGLSANRNWNRGLYPDTDRCAPCATQYGNGCAGRSRPANGGQRVKIAQRTFRRAKPKRFQTGFAPGVPHLAKWPLASRHFPVDFEAAAGALHLSAVAKPPFASWHFPLASSLYGPPASANAGAAVPRPLTTAAMQMKRSMRVLPGWRRSVPPASVARKWHIHGGHQWLLHLGV